MEVILVKPYGFCAGVERAMNLAKKVKEQAGNSNVCILGMLVHNQDALNELNALGIKTLFNKDKSLLELIDDVSDDSIVILSAHGHSAEVENKLIKKGIKFVDATCPFVTMTFNQIKKAVAEGRKVLYIGKENHPESNAALSIDNDVILVDFKKREFDDHIKFPLVINQTTFSHYEIENIIEHIINKIPSATVIKSVCDASTKRQEALLSLPKNIQLIYVVGGENSNNTKTLLEMARSKYQSTIIKSIQNANDVKEKDLFGLSRIAICSGASTPSYICEQIKDKIEKLSN